MKRLMSFPPRAAASLGAVVLVLSAHLGCAEASHPTPSAASATPASTSAAGKMLRDAALMLLKEGNDRYVLGKVQHPNLDAERRTATATGGQEPFATVLACSDSREPVELLFDRGIGDLFIVRVAGNIAGESELASLEYGVGHLNTPVLLVLGHSRCGAVTAVTKGAELHGHLHVLAEHIAPAARKAQAEATTSDDLIPRAIQANVWNTLERILRESSDIREKAAQGSVHLLGGVYDLDSGRVTWLGAHPAQDTIIALANQATTDAALASSKESFVPGAAHGNKAGAESKPAGTPSTAARRGPPPATADEAAKTTQATRGSAKSSGASHVLVGAPAADGTEPPAHEPAPHGHDH